MSAGEDAVKSRMRWPEPGLPGELRRQEFLSGVPAGGGFRKPGCPPGRLPPGRSEGRKRRRISALPDRLRFSGDTGPEQRRDVSQGKREGREADPERQQNTELGKGECIREIAVPFRRAKRNSPGGPARCRKDDSLRIPVQTRPGPDSCGGDLRRGERGDGPVPWIPGGKELTVGVAQYDPDLRNGSEPLLLFHAISLSVPGGQALLPLRGDSRMDLSLPGAAEQGPLSSPGIRLPEGVLFRQVSMPRLEAVRVSRCSSRRGPAVKLQYGSVCHLRRGVLPSPAADLIYGAGGLFAGWAAPVRRQTGIPRSPLSESPCGDLHPVPAGEGLPGCENLPGGTGCCPA